MLLSVVICLALLPGAPIVPSTFGSAYMRAVKRYVDDQFSCFNSAKHTMKLSAAVFWRIIVAAAPALCEAGILSPVPGPIPQAAFGMHIHGIQIPRPNTHKVTPWPDVPFGSWRLHDAGVTWRDLEPARGRFEFARLDEYVRLAEQHHVKVLLPLVSTPTWASARPEEQIRDTAKGSAAEPANLEDWRNFVRTVASRYRGRIEAYEIWNEPNENMFWTGSIPQLVAMTREAYRVIKLADSNALVVLPATTTETGPAYLDSFLSNGGGAYGDVIGYHFYVHANPPEAMAEVASKVKQILSSHKIHKPIWCTEAGWDLPKPFPSEEMAAAYVARSYVVLWASGVARFYWYAWDNHDWVSLQISDSQNTSHTLAAKAYTEIEHWFVGAIMRSCSVDPLGTWTCELDRAGSQQWLAWNPRTTVAFAIPGSWRATISLGLLAGPSPVQSRTKVGPMPVLLRQQETTPMQIPTRSTTAVRTDGLGQGQGHPRADIN